MIASDAYPGQRVVYYPYPGAPGEKGEVDRIAASGLVFVRYGSAAPKATRAEDLYAEPAEPAERAYVPVSLQATPVACPDCGALVINKSLHDRWHLLSNTTTYTLHPGALTIGDARDE